MTGRLQQTIAKYRADLLAREQNAIRALDFAHQQTLKLIDQQLQILYDKMDAAMNAGEDISVSWLYEADRLQLIERYITDNINAFGSTSEVLTNNLQHASMQLGIQSGMALLNSVVPPGVSWTWGMPSGRAIADLVGATQKGSPLADLFDGFGAEAAQKAKMALISGVTLGHGPRQIAPDIQDALNISRNRALVIARTEALRSYRGANQATFQANSDVVGEWRWTCALSVRTCSACLAMDGTIHDLSESLDSHPCCRCVQTPVTKSWDDILSGVGIDSTGIEDTNPALDMQTGEEWFAKQDEKTQKAILGNKYDAWADGQFTLKDVVGTRHSEDWGSSIYEKSLKQLVRSK